MKLPGVISGGADMPEPVLERARPQDLLVDDTYQRNLSARSMKLISRMVKYWDWRSFQPPLVVKIAGAFHVVDGQHTAIAAASHPKIDTIPVLVIEAEQLRDRARAFIGRNRDRVIVTPNQLHYAAVAAQQDDAVTVNTVCERSGVRILKCQPGADYFRAGDTLAVASVYAVVNRHGAMRARQILTVCGKAKLAPLNADVIRAVDQIMSDDRDIDPEDITTAIRDPDIRRRAHVQAAAEEIPAWRMLAKLLIKLLKKRS
jgi:hypothetical protein